MMPDARHGVIFHLCTVRRDGVVIERIFLRWRGRVGRCCNGACVSALAWTRKTVVIARVFLR